MKKFLAMAAATLMLAACGGGGGNGSGGSELSHNELADVFVRELNATGAYDVQIVKSSTKQFNYIVVYDADYGTYDAINISGYRVGDNAAAYYENSSTSILFDLDLIPGYWTYEFYETYDSWCECWVTDYNDVWVADSYRDRASGLYFEKVQSNSKDLEKFAALAEEAVIDNRAEAVAEKFGLSLPRGKEVVRLAMAWKKKGGKDLSEKDQDAFATNILGFSITQAKSAAVEKLAGNSKPLDALVQTAISANDGLTPEEANQLLGEYFGL